MVYIMFYNFFIGITVEFSESMFSSSEFSGEIVVGLQLDGGRFVSPSIVNVTVTATPRSATGMYIYYICSD